MITLYLICKLTGLVIRMCLCLVLLPFRIILFPFRLLFGHPRSNGGNDDMAFWDGFLWGSIFF